MKSTKKKVLCKCGKSVAPNTLWQHANSRACSYHVNNKENLSFLKIILQKRLEKTLAWKKEDGINATGCKKWWHSVWIEETVLEDWTFDPPRPVGSMTPKSAKKMGQERRGKNNPLARKRIKNYNLEEVRVFIENLLKTDLMFREIIKKTSEKFPHLWYQIQVDLPKNPERGCNKENLKVAKILGTDYFWVFREKIRRRGFRISEGQKNSSVFYDSAVKSALRVQHLKVTKPQKKLFGIVKKQFPDAISEYTIFHDGRAKFYDIFIPSKGILVEMHGHVFHRETKNSKKNSKLKKIVLQNINNDLQKAEIAKKNNFHLFIFWDDEEDQWEAQLQKKLELLEKDL